MKKFLMFLIPALFFLGCSTKDVFVPKNPKKETLRSENLDKTLQDYTKTALTFKKLQLTYKKTKSILGGDGAKWVWVYYTKNGKKLGKYRKISKDLAVNGMKMLLIKENKIINLPYMVYSATRKNDLIAIVFENDAIGLFDLKKNKLVFYKRNTPVLCAKYLGASPVFYNALILYPLLDGKVAIVDAKTHNFIRNLFVYDAPINDNVIFLKIINDKLFMATPNRIILFNPNFMINYDARIKHVIAMDNYVYLFLVGGKIIKFDTSLKKIKEINLPFADYFAPSVCKGNIYTITSNGYLIKITKNLKVTVYEGTKFDTESPLRIDKCKIYNDNKVYFIE